MSLNLTVIHNFANYERGDVIKDGAEIEQILNSENHANVVKIVAPDAPFALPEAAPTKSAKS